MPGKPYPISKIKEVINAGGDVVHDCLIDTLLTDSRRVSGAPGGLFFALSGRRNGHEFIKDAYASGVRSFVVAESKGRLVYPELIS